MRPYMLSYFIGFYKYVNVGDKEVVKKRVRKDKKELFIKLKWIL